MLRVLCLWWCGVFVLRYYCRCVAVRSAEGYPDSAEPFFGSQNHFFWFLKFLPPAAQTAVYTISESAILTDQEMESYPMVFAQGCPWSPHLRHHAVKKSFIADSCREDPFCTQHKQTRIQR